MPNPTYSNRIATIDLPRIKGIILDQVRNRRFYFTVIDTESGIFAIEVTDVGHRFDLRLRTAQGSVKSLQRRNIDAAVEDCLVAARRRGIDPIVWILTNSTATNPTTPDPT
jgi:hypothetical protein